MNRQEQDILNILAGGTFSGQRELAEESGYSLGVVNRCLRSLTETGYVRADGTLTQNGQALLAENRPQRAVILAAGFGMRMVPINTETPKGLLQVHGERLMDRLIRQLHQAGIRDIRVVVGFLKEQYEYLIDEFGVELVVNPDYARKNNLHSVDRVRSALSDCYVVPCDLYCTENPFRTHEFYSWYMVSEAPAPDSTVRVNRKQALIPVSENGNRMIGICYLTADDGRKVSEKVHALCLDSRMDGAFWEEALYAEGKMLPAARVVPEGQVVEINTYEQLRELDGDSDQLQNDAIGTICRVFDASPRDITHITVLKKGMTNRSFLFTCRGKQYIMRIPGEGTDRLIDRRQEAAVYGAIRDLSLCDDVYYIDPANGYKITAFLENARVCDPENPNDVRRCMAFLRKFHERRLHVGHSFDIFGQIEFYEQLWKGNPSVYADYRRTKEQILSLRPYMEAHAGEKVLTHIDAVPDNFLLTGDDIRLIDWEYAGEQDPHVDIAMFAIYALYDRAQIDTLIDAYFPEGCPGETRLKIYCYVAACGLLWSNWCEYKRQLGVEFGEYSLRQYRYAKEFYRIFRAEEGEKA
ncbi:MAG: phosphocholine cytidylyltransferase/choline kinase family protein [Clostridiales bacterium]|nr:phosphocholine cytidylyltransferase/choline kinase family protein [Clostridiales bacterium]